MELTKVTNGEFLSEISHYQAQKDANLGISSVSLNHLSSNKAVGIAGTYIKNYCISAEQFDDVEIVGKENKYWTSKQVKQYIDENWNEETNIHEFAANVPQVGQLRVKGIRTIFQDIRDKTAFTVWFYKAPKKKTSAEYNSEIDNRVKMFMAPIEKAKAHKKSMEEAARSAVLNLIQNPVTEYHEPELRKMICYKLDFSSRDGHYKVFDLEAQDTRLVNIKTIQALVINGTKYELE